MAVGHESNIQRAGQYEKIIERLFDIEEECNLFDISIQGVPIWERLRFPVTRKVLIETGVFSQPHTPIDRSLNNYLKGALDWARYSVRKNPMFGEEHELLFYGVSRRKRREDGKWWDYLCDPIIDHISRSTALMEDPYLLEHKKPTPSEPVYYLDFVRYSAKLSELFGLMEPCLKSREKRQIERMEDSFRNEFEIDINLIEMARTELFERAVKLGLYSRILDRLSPQLVFLVCSYGKETFIEACQDREIPVIELQHGGFNRDHFGYSFPGDRDKKMFPDYLFTFGEYWKEVVEFPIDDENVVPVGYPYFEEETKKYDHVKKRNQIIITSQGSKGEIVSDFAVTLSNIDSFDYDIVYKLHPGEYDRWQAAYPELGKADLRVIDADEPPLYRLLAESKAHVGINSTVLYEGFYFDLETYILSAPTHTTMEPVFDMEHVHEIDGVRDFLDYFTPSQNNINWERFFKPDALENIESAIKEISGESLSDVREE